MLSQRMRVTESHSRGYLMSATHFLQALLLYGELFVDVRSKLGLPAQFQTPVMCADTFAVSGQHQPPAVPGSLQFQRRPVRLQRQAQVRQIASRWVTAPAQPCLVDARLAQHFPGEGGTGRVVSS